MSVITLVSFARISILFILRYCSAKNCFLKLLIVFHAGWLNGLIIFNEEWFLDTCS